MVDFNGSQRGNFKHACYNGSMESFEFNVKMKVTLPAFNASDAEEAVRDALEDIDALGATVTDLIVDLEPGEG